MKATTAILNFLGANVPVNVALAQESMPNIEAWHSWHAHSHGFWWIFPLLMFVIFLLCMRRFSHWWVAPPWHRGPHSGGRRKYEGSEDTNSQSALELLNRRFAQGEIDKEEYEEKKAIISSPSV